jgi:hypothetical protein
MKKKFAILMFIISVLLAFHSCDYSLPKEIELEVEGSINLPVKIMTSNWGSMVANVFKKMFSGDDEDATDKDKTDEDDRIKVEVYDVNYGQKTQAFLVYAPIPISKSLNPKDHLKDVTEYLTRGEFDMMIEEKIVVPSSFADFGTENQTISIPSGGSIELDPISLGDTNKFLQAKIKRGVLSIIMEPAGDQVEIEITQESYNDSELGNYTGLEYSHKNSTTKPFEGQYINGKDIKVKITNQAGVPLTSNLKITMKITEFSEMYWNITDTRQLEQPDPVKLEPAAQYLNWIEFNKCAVIEDDKNPEDKGKPTEGIGIDMYFEEIFTGLKMEIKCDKLQINEKKDIGQGHNVFGNKLPLKGETATAENAERLLLADPQKKDNPKIVSTLDFEIELFSSDDAHPNVLHLNKSLEVGEILKIDGKARFFQIWETAQVNMNEVLNAEKADGSEYPFKGEFPAADDDPIDLSMLNNYLKGFNFSSPIQAAAYLSGPNKTIENIPSMLNITAKYTRNGVDASPPPIVQLEKLKLQENRPDIRPYFDKKNSYNNNGELPNLTEKIPFNFMNIINDRPDDLKFQYDIKLPDTIDVERTMFLDKSDDTVSHDILATIMLLIHLELTADVDGVELTDGSRGGQIRFPDMFERRDLFGRGSLEGDSMFTLLDKGYISLSINFASPFFSKGTLFIEKCAINRKGDEIPPVLFPEGILLKDKSIKVDIQYEKIRDYFIIPEFRLEFKPGETIRIPRNMGVASVTIKAKGRRGNIPLNLDF